MSSFCCQALLSSLTACVRWRWFVSRSFIRPWNGFAVYFRVNTLPKEIAFLSSKYENNHPNDAIQMVDSQTSDQWDIFLKMTLADITSILLLQHMIYQSGSPTHSQGDGLPKDRTLSLRLCLTMYLHQAVFNNTDSHVHPCDRDTYLLFPLSIPVISDLTRARLLRMLTRGEPSVIELPGNSCLFF